MAENFADDCRIVDEGDHTHGALAPRTFERIDFVDLVNQARPGGPDAGGVTLVGYPPNDLGWFPGHAPVLSPATVRIPAGIPHQVLETIRDMSAKLRQPVGAGHDLEVALEGLVHP